MATQTLTPPSGVAQTYNPQTGQWGDFNAPTSGVSPLSSSYNPGTNAGGSTTKSLTNPDSVSGSVPDTGNSIADQLNAEFDSGAQKQTIMQQYAQNASILGNQSASNKQSIIDTGNNNLSYENEQDKNAGTSLQEGQSGFVINPGAIKVLQDAATQRVRTLTTQMNDAVANNQTSLASSLSQNIIDENNAITAARTQFLSNYFNSQQESRAQASFQTPEQQSVMSMAATYPQAGVLPTDSLAVAQQKVTASPQFQLGLQSTQSGITATQAGAGLAGAQKTLTGAQATQQLLINNLMNGLSGSTDALANQLILNQKDPTQGVSAEQLQGNLANVPGGPSLAQKVIQAAQKKGYSQAGATLGNTAAETNTRNLSSGGYTGASTAVTNTLGGLFNSIFSGSTPQSTNSLGTTKLTGPDGKLYDVPNSQVNAFITAGGHY